MTAMLPGCVIVHGPVGNTCWERGGRAIVMCFQRMRIHRVPDLPPFLVQAVATRVWFSTDEGWRLGHMQLLRRQPSA
ncbi:hypothetical protein AB0D91_42190 [Streptomyces canus]|uniref:hypothetical protein n=1 Tax=Streptomyces canus TaxID=58343 RepID=UPI0033FFE0F2